jgi:cytochrome c-type biogenesis protein CcmH/NrfG
MEIPNQVKEDRTKTSSLSIAGLLLRLFLVIALGVLLIVAARGYYSNYYLVAARMGEKSLASYEALLRRAIEHDKTNGRAATDLAVFLAAQRRYEEAERVQSSALKTYRPVGGFELLGRTEEKLAEVASTESRTMHAARSRELYEKAARVRPGNVSALEHLMVFAYRDNDYDKMDALATEVSRADIGNLNAIYLRALAAERRQNRRAAYGLYQQLVGAPSLPPGTFFTTATVEQRLRQLSTSEKL